MLDRNKKNILNNLTKNLFNDFFLALSPMEDVTDTTFRKICKTYGADLVFTEFVAADGLIRNLEKTRKTVLAGEKSPLAYHMERRQMIPDILGKTAGIAVFRVKRHLRPEIFARLKNPVLERYAKALAITMEELKTVPEESRE